MLLFYFIFHYFVYFPFKLMNVLLKYTAGHLYLFFETILPQTHSLNLLKTPGFLYSFFPPAANRNAPGARAAPRPQGTCCYRYNAGVYMCFHVLKYACVFVRVCVVCVRLCV